MWGQGSKKLQWSHDLSAMDTSKARCCPPASTSFNGAMTFQPWIRRRTRIGWRSTTSFNGAMTFQPWIHGPDAPYSATCASFNGAMTFQPWIHARIHNRPPGRNPRFNGAMTFQPWIHRIHRYAPKIPVPLQWSHDLSAMDTIANLSNQPFSMTLQWSHDLSAMDTVPFSRRTASTSAGFNGAMTFQPWILYL